MSGHTPPKRPPSSPPVVYKVGALHHDAGKSRFELICYESHVSEANGMEYGAIKYARDDWRLGMVASKLVGSIMRHITKYSDVETYDIESGLHHMDHLNADGGILAWLVKNRPDLDDRYVGARRTPYSLEEIMAYRKRVGLKTSDQMLSFIKRNVEKSMREYEANLKAKQ